MRQSTLLLLLTLTAFTCRTTKHAPSAYTYHIDDKALYDTIRALDSIFFDAYNHCDQQLAKHAAFYSDSIEFYHDRGGLSNNKEGIIESIRKNVCGKVSRTLIKQSLEVYPIPGFGAIEMGLHSFYNNQEPNVAPHASRFTIVWQRTSSGWKVRKVISLH